MAKSNAQMSDKNTACNVASNVHVVPHMHWDREWYFTTEESKILLVNNMEEIMERLEQDDDYPSYVLDGQTAVLEDYFSVKPENRDRVKKLVQQGKLIVGPWYTQTDEMVVGGESVARNLLYGLKDSRELGDPMMIGYLPDSFGQSEKMPQILNGFGIDWAIFWRGSSERNGTTKHNFNWKSNTEGEVLTHLFPLGYAIGKYLPLDPDELKTRMDKYLPVLDAGAVNENIVLPNGHDQMPIQKNIFEVMDQLKKLYPERNFFLSRYENVFDDLDKADDLDTIQGELLDGKYMRVHRSIFSTRADLKSSNTRIENKITNILEPLASVAYSLGAPYEEGLIESIWKELLKNHAHDSIGCCCSDKVHKYIENRFFLAEDKTDELIRYYERKITDAMSCEDSLDKLTAFNLLPYERDTVVEAQITTKMKNFTLSDESGKEIDFEVLKKEVVDAGLIDRQIVHYGDYDPFVRYDISFRDTIPPMGYKAYFVKEADGEAQIDITQESKPAIENSRYSIEIRPNGSLNILDKETDRRYHNVLLIEDGSDDGDEYDYSPLADDFIITSGDTKAEITTKHSGNVQEAEIRYSLMIPNNLESRRNRLCDSQMDVCLKLKVKIDTPVIEVNAEIDNRSEDHRVRVLIPNEIGADFSCADNQFGMIKRAVVDSAIEVWETEHWSERPDAIYPMLSYIRLDNEDGLAVLTNSVREYEVTGVDYDTIAVTLFRSVGFLGKEEMLRRPGRPSGIKMPTPDSQLIGRQHFEFAIAPNENVEKSAKEYTTPVVSYNKMPYNAMKLNTPDFKAPYTYSLLTTDSPGFVLSALKKAQGKENLVLRGYQVTGAPVPFRISEHQNTRMTAEVNLNEDAVAAVEEDQIITIPENVVKSFALSL